jgi:hypothetical protein
VASDLPTFRARLLDERAAVVAELNAIDLAAEQARLAAAEDAFRTASNLFEKATRRWGLINEKQNRLVVLDDQIAMVTP